jgi:mono/diheme cytochrome c family protein
MDGSCRREFRVLIGKGAWRVALLAALFAFARSASAGSDTVSYNNQIGPILSEHCFRCHGPDSATRKPKKHPLRLDRGELAYELRDDGKPVIIKGDPGASELVRRITATDDDVMPPASEHKPMTTAEIALIKQWISQGGKYQKHWSLIPPVMSPVPMDGAAWARSPIDNFVARKLAQNGLAPNPEEDKARLYRRLSFDLTGLPPSPRELEKFVRSGSDKAYEKAVDRMLASDAGAEHFTRLWLDAVRYADTQGIHLDYARSVWPYRDWVIAAFKTNMPFDQFTIEQIAGDMLPGATERQKIASGYNRLLETTSEGGAIPEEYAAVYAKDRVDTTSAVWLGLTIGCATCHDHKFDPITTKDFYSMTAFFRNNTSSILDGPNGNNAPTLFLPVSSDVAEWKQLEPAIAKSKQAAAARKVAAGPEFTNWFNQTSTNPIDPPISIQPVLILPLTESNGPYGGNSHGKRLQWAGGLEKKDGPFGPAPLLTNGAAVEGGAPVIARDGQASYGAFIYVEERPNGAVISRMNTATNFRGWDLYLSDGRPTAHIIDQFPDKALKVTAKGALEPGRWHHVMAVFDGQRQGAGAISLFVDGMRAAVDVNNNNLGSNIVADVPFRLGGRSAKEGPAEFVSGRVFLQDLRFYDKALTSEDVARLALAGLERGPAMAKSETLVDLYLIAYDRSSQMLAAELTGLEAEAKPIRRRGATTLVMAEKADTKPIAHVLLRGNYTTEGEEVSAATPVALPPMAPDAPRTRLGLARWIMSRQDPLVARVTVNRLWAQLFGAGIVETTEDFGVMGARPTDQNLLDWLAVDFMDSGWNFRQVVKTIVMSATYRQSEAISPGKLEKDPQNKLLSRGPHVRLDAEEIRDQALAASGLLVNNVGGPPVKPYQPEGVWESVAMKESDTRVYVPDTGTNLYRRSLYTYWKRTAPPPNMEILNAPTRETFCTRRERTDTPLQALVTLNDTQFIEASRSLAERAILSSKKFDSRLDEITEPLLGRTMGPGERLVMRKMEQRFQTRYQGDPSDAKALVAVGESKPDPKIPPAELAAWTLVASEILNLDESLTK